MYSYFYTMLLYSSYGDKDHKARSLNNLVTSLKNMNNYDEALKYCQQFLILSKELCNKVHLYYILLQILIIIAGKYFHIHLPILREKDMQFIFYNI